MALDGFLSGLPAGVQLFSLFEANPQLIDLLVDIVGTSPDLASYLSRNSSVFDAVIGGDFFADWPGMAALRDDLATRLAAEPDYERQLDTARRWTKEWQFRVGVHHAARADRRRGGGPAIRRSGRGGDRRPAAGGRGPVRAQARTRRRGAARWCWAWARWGLRGSTPPPISISS